MKLLYVGSVVLLVTGALMGCASNAPVESPTGGPLSTDEASPSLPGPPVGQGAVIVATIPIPNDGPVAYGADSVWVDDRADGLVEDGVPAGILYRVNPASGEITAEIPGVVGGYVAVGEGAVWLVTLAGDLDVVTRVDLENHAVTMVGISTEPDPEPEGIAIVGGGVWVANNHPGTVVRLDPQTYELTASIQVAPAGDGGPQSAATNGSSLWVAVPREEAVVRIDPAAERVAARIELPASNPGSASMAADQHAVWVTNGGESTASNVVFRINAETDTLEAAIDVAGTGVDVAIGFGALWVVTESPTALVRIDPQTNLVTGRLLLPAQAGSSFEGRLAVLGLAIGDAAIWVRVDDALLKVEPE
jgi:streptogramin lyase